MKSERIKWIDTAKGICIFLVIFGHCITREGAGKVFFLNRFIYSFHMPLFFILSGINLNVNASPADFVKKRIIRVLLPVYGFVFLFNICMAVINASAYTGGKYSVILKLLLCFRDSMIANWWFLPALFTAQLLLFFMDKLSDKFLKIAILAACLLLCMINHANGDIALPFCLEIAVLAMPFLAAGFYGKELLSRSFSFKGFALAALVWLACIAISVKCGYGAMDMWSCKIYNMPLFLASGLSGSYIIIHISKIMENISVFGKLGKETLLIYGVHYIFLEIFCQIAERYVENFSFAQNLFIVFIGSVTILACSYIAAILIGKIIIVYLRANG